MRLGSRLQRQKSGGKVVFVILSHPNIIGCNSIHSISVFGDLITFPFNSCCIFRFNSISLVEFGLVECFAAFVWQFSAMDLCWILISLAFLIELWFPCWFTGKYRCFYSYYWFEKSCTTYLEPIANIVGVLSTERSFAIMSVVCNYVAKVSYGILRWSWYSGRSKVFLQMVFFLLF